MQTYNTIVIGAGSAGVRYARLAASHGEDIALIEESKVGGTCVNLGCVPKKLMTYAAKFSIENRRAMNNGWSVSPSELNWQTLQGKIFKEIGRLNGIYETMLINNGVNLIKGKAKFVSDNIIDVNGELIRGETIIIATGGKPRRLSIPGGNYAITSDEFFSMKKIPKKVAIFGNGYIGVEFAGILNGFGSETLLIGKSNLPLKGFDNEIRESLKEAIKTVGIKITTRAVSNIEKTTEGYRINFSDGTMDTVDMVIAAIGRIPNTQDLGIENTTIQLQNDRIVSDNEGKCNADGTIYALGDVTNFDNLTPVATSEATELFQSFYEGEWYSPDYKNVPKAVFFTYPVASCGKTEEEAVAENIDVDIYRSNFTPMSQVFSNVKVKTLMKMIVRKEDDVVIGIHMFGEDAPEIVQGMSLAVVNGLTKPQVDMTIGIHPTSAEEFVTMR